MTKLFCLECEAHPATSPDPRNPPLEEGDTLCDDCFLNALEEIAAECEDELMQAREYLTETREKLMYERGFIEGLTRYAWWQDGTQYVGTTGTTLKEAITEFRERKK